MSIPKVPNIATEIETNELDARFISNELTCMLSSCTNCPNHSISKAERFNFFPLVLLNEAERAEGGVTWFPNSRPNVVVVVRALGRVLWPGAGTESIEDLVGAGETSIATGEGAFRSNGKMLESIGGEPGGEDANLNDCSRSEA